MGLELEAWGFEGDDGLCCDDWLCLVCCEYLAPAANGLLPFRGDDDDDDAWAGAVVCCCELVALLCVRRCAGFVGFGGFFAARDAKPAGF